MASDSSWPAHFAAHAFFGYHVGDLAFLLAKSSLLVETVKGRHRLEASSQSLQPRVPLWVTPLAFTSEAEPLSLVLRCPRCSPRPLPSSWFAPASSASGGGGGSVRRTSSPLPPLHSGSPSLYPPFLSGLRLSYFLDGPRIDLPPASAVVFHLLFVNRQLARPVLLLLLHKPLRKLPLLLIKCIPRARTAAVTP